MIKRARLFIKNLFKKEKLFNIKEYRKSLKKLSKSDLIRELAYQSQRINKNDAGISTSFKKKLRAKSKSDLINTLILLRLHEYKPIKKLRKKANAQAKKERKRK